MIILAVNAKNAVAKKLLDINKLSAQGLLTGSLSEDFQPRHPSGIIRQIPQTLVK